MMEPEDIAIMIAGDDRILAPAPLGLVEATLRLPNSMAPIALVSQYTDLSFHKNL